METISELENDLALKFAEHATAGSRESSALSQQHAIAHGIHGNDAFNDRPADDIDIMGQQDSSDRGSHASCLRRGHESRRPV